MMQAVIPRAAGTSRSARNREPGEATATVTARLAAEFPALARETVERRVQQTWMCARHLGLPVTDGLVERIAREHLRGLLNSVPPSRRR